MDLGHVLLFCEKFDIKVYSNPHPSKYDVLDHISKLFPPHLGERYNLSLEKRHALPDEIAQALRDREDLVTTGVGHKIALPNAKIAGIPRAYFGLYGLPDFDWQSMDDQPVNLVIPIIGGYDSFSPHLNMMAKIGDVLKDPTKRRMLLEATEYTLPEYDVEKIKYILDNP